MDDEDNILWNKMKEGIKPLPSSKKKPKEQKTPIFLKNTETKTSEVRKKTIKLPSLKKQPELKTNAVAGVDKNIIQKIKKGKIPIDATLDLHGFTVEKACSTFKQFILYHFSCGSRLLLVITGKGKLSEKGILRSQLSTWCNLPGISPYILYLGQAQAQHGGSGAFYIYLRKNNR